MKQYICTMLESTRLSTSVRISISYYSLTRKNSPRVLDKLYIRVGRLVVSITLPREKTLHLTLRHILIPLLGFPIILDKVSLVDLSRDSQTDLENLYSTLPSIEQYKDVSLYSLMEYLATLMAFFCQSVHGGRLSIPSFSDTRAIPVCLAMNYIILLDKYAQLSRDLEKKKAKASVLLPVG